MMQPSRFNFIEKSIFLLLLVYPTAMFAIRGGMNGVFLLMLLVGLWVWIRRAADRGKWAWQPEYTAYGLAMCSMSVAILISQIWNQNLTAHPHDAAARYWLGIPVFLLLVRQRMAVLSVVQFAFPPAAIAGFLLSNKTWDRAGISTLDLIHFGDFVLLLGVLSLFALDWVGRDRLAARALKLLGFIAGVAASIATGTRGSWLAIPLFVLIYIYFNRERLSWRAVTGYVSALALGLFLLYSLNPAFHERTRNLVSDMANYEQGNRDTSIGIRWQLYLAALNVFERHPVFGVGPEGFALQMQSMTERGEITAAAAELGRAEVHNDILAKAAGMGIFGLGAILAIYLVPLWLFWRASQSSIRQKCRAGILGFTFVSGFMVFGLTAEILNLTMATAFYSFTVAVLLATSYNVHHDGQDLAQLSRQD